MREFTSNGRTNAPGPSAPAAAELSSTMNGGVESGRGRPSRMTPSSEQFYRCLLEQAPDAVVVVDHAGLITLANRQAERVFGRRRQELLGQGLSVLAAGRCRAECAALLSDDEAVPGPARPGSPLDLACLDKGGREFTVQVARSRVETPAGGVVLLTFRDVTE